MKEKAMKMIHVWQVLFYDWKLLMVDGSWLWWWWWWWRIQWKKASICWVAMNLSDNLRHATYCWHFCCNILHVSDRFISSFKKLFIFSLPGSRVGTLRKMMMIFDLAIPSEVCFPDYTPLARMFQKPSSLPTMHSTAMYLVNVRRSTCQHRVISTCCWDPSWLPLGNGNMT